jgi:hypothetical protein
MKYLFSIPFINARYGFYFGLLFVVSIVTWLIPAPSLWAQEPADPIYLPLIVKSPDPGGPSISSVSTNVNDYAAGQIPRYDKFEITFAVDTVAPNLQLPYDPLPPAGIAPDIGITVNALFTPDNWHTIYTQPAFYYEEFQDEVKGGKEWFYPTGNGSWKVRFAPDQVGTWQFRLTAQDMGGITETQPFSFTVTSSNSKGFIRVSANDSRYFEYDDGTYFPALGYNMNYRGVDWISPVLNNQAKFQAMADNDIQLIRIWLSQWAIFGSAWNPWRMHVDNNYLPATGLTFSQTHPQSNLSMVVSATWNRCMFTNWETAAPAVKRNTSYRIRVQYKTFDIPASPTRIDPSNPNYGFVIKTGGWLWGDLEQQKCSHPAAGTVVSEYVNFNTNDWQILEGTINTGNSDYLPSIYLTMGNLTAGKAYVDHVWVQENLGNGQYGPNIMYKPDMDHHLYMDQRNSYAFDKVVELAEAHNVYLRPVIHEKNDWVMNSIDYEGNFTWNDSNNYFYGNWRAVTKMRWLQQAWWRYLQARWGYSTHIHSWELLNEGDPGNDRHFALADELGKYMHCRVFNAPVGNGNGDTCGYNHPNDHLVSTSNWHSFPKLNFWANSNYPNVDFADIHSYIPESNPNHYDAALASQSLSNSSTLANTGKPIIRGETGFTEIDSGPESEQVKQDTAGIWLHNFIWAGVNPGGLIESYWYEDEHIYNNNVDFRPHFKTYYNFIKNIPLSNGHYEDAGAQVAVTVGNAGDLRAWGQKDLANGCAHLWLQNRNHTWQNVVNGSPIAAITGTITVSGFSPGEEYTVERWDTYQPDETQQVIQVDQITAQSDGSLLLPVSNLTTDVALKIISAGGCTNN